MAYNDCPVLSINFDKQYYKNALTNQRPIIKQRALSKPLGFKITHYMSPSEIITGVMTKNDIDILKIQARARNYNASLELRKT